ncbi:MAG: class I SAM-dependent methyltransferase [Candidatus Omnitrophica bacterium]|nr:class I SAM-dependent methyltransferase [Candidatus Omnitrophota bacterium]
MTDRRQVIIEQGGDVLECPVCQSLDHGLKYSCLDMSIFRCSRCGMMFQNSLSPVVALNAHAVDVFEQDMAKTDIRRAASRSTLARIASHMERPLRGLRVLEIGGGLGHLGSCFIDAGAEYVGVEPSKELYGRALSFNPVLDGRILNSTVEDALSAGQRYDLVVLVDTLEHIPYPVAYLGALKKCLSAEGLIYVEVPNESWLRLKGGLRRLFNVYSGYITHPGHVNLFQVNTLRRALSAAGYSHIFVSQYSVFGDYGRMSLALKGKWDVLCRIGCAFFKHTRMDIMLQQGNICACARI